MKEITLNRENIKGIFFQHLKQKCLFSTADYCYLSSETLNNQDIQELDNINFKIKDFLIKKASEFWLAAFCTIDKIYFLYSVSLSGSIEYISSTTDIGDLDIFLAPLSGWKAKELLPDKKDTEITLQSSRLPIDEMKDLISHRSDNKEKFVKNNKIAYIVEKIQYLELIFVSIVYCIMNFYTAHYWFSWFVTVALIFGFGHYQEIYKINDLTNDNFIKKCLFMYGKEFCWFIFFIMSGTYSGLLGIAVTMLYPVYRKIFEKKFKNYL